MFNERVDYHGNIYLIADDSVNYDDIEFFINMINNQNIENKNIFINCIKEEYRNYKKLNNDNNELKQRDKENSKNISYEDLSNEDKNIKYKIPIIYLVKKIDKIINRIINNNIDDILVTEKNPEIGE